jgi:DNA-binding transcriptional MerR regulator
MQELLKIREVAKILKVHPNTLRNWDRKGILIAVRIGERKIRRYRLGDIKKLIKK